jgi:hypothetical protein
MCSNGSSIEPGKKRTRISTWHERKSTQKLFAILVALGAQGLAYAQGAPAAPGTVTHAVDAQIFKGPKEIADAGRGPRPLAAVADAKGVVSRFIADEVIFRGSSSDLTAFLAKHSGKVISTIEPAKSPTGVAPRPGVPPQPASVIRLDPTNFSAQNLDADSGKLGLKGAVKFSSSQGESLAAIAASELAKGSKVSLNFVSEGHDFLYSTQEQGGADAFTWTEFDHRAWQFIAEHGITRRVKLAIVDGGFWLDSSGKPFPDANGRSDLPAQPIQHDAITQGPFAGGPNPNTCTGGKPCLWHGHRSASVVLNTAS